ncbi:uncharacterized protein BDZ99DRAFT_461490 [Mytilinidion resinicola]|uniref:Protein kinase domain-containing protein n=1 Tax=Mytilinidion resinicola TaxID=574789 RepID=A0A6A6YSS3_9PEZI|nr:uncharacterized protein BDZ99DRAFT_461490 [Mytilinidion resinicola]KAF2811423.1 hypothetical protein BDZ99DRAFT_461490 [Mytilinidion resinicola]
MAGSLNKLVPLSIFKKEQGTLLNEVAFQMLSALDYLSPRGLCHRDVKPENILHYKTNGKHTFQLADFGFANYQNQANTACGTCPQSVGPATAAMHILNDPSTTQSMKDAYWTTGCKFRA